MYGYSIDADELAACRKLIEDHAESFGNIGVELGPEDSNPSWLGTLPSGTNLATACRNLHAAARAEFSAAQEFLLSVGRELGEGGRNRNETEFANVEAIQSVRTKLGYENGSSCPS